MITQDPWRNSLWSIVLLILTHFLGLPTLAMADIEAPPLPREAASIKSPVASKKEPLLAKDHMIWNFGLNVARNFLKSAEGNSILGSHGAVQFGAGYLTPRWYAFGSLDFITGPFEPVTVGELNVDYIGTGFSVWSGMSPWPEGLRSGGVGYGVALGVSYNDLVGRSIGYGGRRPTVDNGSSEVTPTIESYTLDTTNVSVIPALFISLLEKPRVIGNTPDLLATRLEGHILTIGLAFPVIAEFSKRTVLSDGQETVINGAMKGRRIEVTWTALLAP
jgi:hypothetical protein